MKFYESGFFLYFIGYIGYTFGPILAHPKIARQFSLDGPNIKTKIIHNKSPLQIKGNNEKKTLTLNLPHTREKVEAQRLLWLEVGKEVGDGHEIGQTHESVWRRPWMAAFHSFEHD